MGNADDINGSVDGEKTNSRTRSKSLSRRELLTLLGIMGLGGISEAGAQDAAKVNPRSYRVLLENDKVRVLEYRSLPGFGVCGQGKHSHPAHVTIAISPGKVMVVDSEGKSRVSESKPDEVFWSPAETHSVENISGRPIYFRPPNACTDGRD